jgi:hypothetical protein
MFANVAASMAEGIAAVAQMVRTGRAGTGSVLQSFVSSGKIIPRFVIITLYNFIFHAIINNF